MINNIFSKKSKILITGSSGFLGSQITKQLIEKGYENIYLLSRRKQLKTKFKNRVKYIFSKNLFKENLYSIKSKLKGIDLVIHCAWYVNPRDYLTSEKNIECLYGSIIFAKACLMANVKKFIGIGTSFEYSLTKKTPLNCDDKIFPETMYSASKASLYFILRQLFKNKLSNFNWYRVFYLYGENEKKGRLYPKVISLLKKNKKINIGEGKQIRDYLNIKDAASMIIEYSIKNKKEVKNICSSKPITIKAFVKSIAKKENKLNLLSFKKKKNIKFDPAYVVGSK